MSAYPVTQKVDIEMLWNPDVLNIKNVADDAVGSQAAEEAILCTDSYLDNLPSSSVLNVNSTTNVTMSDVVAFTMQNVWISSAVSGGQDALRANAGIMDMCMSYSTSSNFFT